MNINKSEIAQGLHDGEVLYVKSSQRSAKSVLKAHKRMMTKTIILRSTHHPIFPFSERTWAAYQRKEVIVSLEYVSGMTEGIVEEINNMNKY